MGVKEEKERDWELPVLEEGGDAVISFVPITRLPER